MKGPDDLVSVLSLANEGQSHQRSARHIKPKELILLQQSHEPLLLLGVSQAAPVKVVDRKLDLSQHCLNRRLDVIPDEEGAQDGMAINDSLPGLPELLYIGELMHREADLPDVHSRSRSKQGLE